MEEYFNLIHQMKKMRQIQGNDPQPLRGSYPKINSQYVTNENARDTNFFIKFSTNC